MRSNAHCRCLVTEHLLSAVFYAASGSSFILSNCHSYELKEARQSHSGLAEAPNTVCARCRRRVPTVVHRGNPGSELKRDEAEIISSYKGRIHVISGLTRTNQHIYSLTLNSAVLAHEFLPQRLLVPTANSSKHADDSSCGALQCEASYACRNSMNPHRK